MRFKQFSIKAKQQIIFLILYFNNKKLFILTIT